MTYRRLAWIACFLIGASLVGCDTDESDRSTKELEKKVDALTKKVDALHELLVKHQPAKLKPADNLRFADKLPLPSCQPYSENGMYADRCEQKALTIPFSVHELAGKKLILDFRRAPIGNQLAACDQFSMPGACYQPFLPILKFPLDETSWLFLPDFDPISRTFPDFHTDHVQITW